MSHGHRRVGASVESLIAAAVSEMSPMVRSAIGFRSWSCGGEVVWWMSSAERNARNVCDISLPSRSPCTVRTVGRGSGWPASSMGVPTVALKAAMHRLIAASASDFNLMNSTKTKREYSSMQKTT